MRMPKAYTSTLLLTFLLQMSASGATYAAVPQLLKGKLAWMSSSSTRLRPKSLTYKVARDEHACTRSTSACVCGTLHLLGHLGGARAQLPGVSDVSQPKAQAT